MKIGGYFLWPEQRDIIDGIINDDSVAVRTVQVLVNRRWPTQEKNLFYTAVDVLEALLEQLEERTTKASASLVIADEAIDAISVYLEVEDGRSWAHERALEAENDRHIRREALGEGQIPGEGGSASGDDPSGSVGPGEGKNRP